jgi:hypothetical protein
MGDSFNPNTYDDKFISDLVAFVAADEFQSMFEHFFIQFALEFTDDEEHTLRYIVENLDTLSSCVKSTALHLFSLPIR